LANSNNTVRTQHVIPIKAGVVSIFAPFNFAVLFSLRNKGRANIDGFAVMLQVY